MRVALAVSLMCAVLVAHPARADEAAESNTLLGRESFERGTELAQAGQWREALDAYERAASLRAHPVVTYNIAYCERSLGHYTRARHFFLEALAQHEHGRDGVMRDAMFRSVPSYLSELEGLIARVVVTLEPRDTAIAIDGRPLSTMDMAGAMPVLAAGVLPPSSPKKPRAARFVLRIDPGEHTILLSHPDAADTAMSRTFVTGEDATLTLAVEMPAPVASEEPPPLREPWLDDVAAYGVVAGGAALLVAGGFMGISYLSSLGRLEDVCVEGECPSDRGHQIDYTNALGTASVVVLVTGALTTGLGIFLTTRSGSMTESSAVQPWMGPGGAGVRGVF